MTDVVDAATRSRMMSGIRGKDTLPEIQIRKGLYSLGFRYRLHGSALLGKPDIVLKKYRAVIFVNGCFWHRHGCYLFKWPKTRPEFWKKKLDRNHENDLKAITGLREQGWRVCVVWECALKGTGKDVGKIVEKIAKWLNGSGGMLEISG